MQVRFLQPVQYELDEAVDYYNAQMSNLGNEFLIEILAALDRIALWPDAWHEISKNIRRCQLKRFPYGVVYVVEGNVILVIAIGHLHRRPTYWQTLNARNLKP